MNQAVVSVLLAALLVSCGSNVLAQTCSRQSPSHTIALLELYTSEGCDSCPRADRFVSNLRLAGLQAEQVVPLSLHVDYWDYIGWKDTFASHIFTDRQRWLNALADSRTVYTPEVFIAGRELRNWRDASAATVRAINRRPAQADLGITLGRISGNSLPLEINARVGQPVTLFVVLYENGLTTEVKSGENRGTTLKHDYVVRDWIGPVALSAGGPGGKSDKVVLPRFLKVPNNAVMGNLGVAAFVQTSKGDVLQVLSSPICSG
jgi:hypothetical protein